MTQSEREGREDAQVARAERIHTEVMHAMARERPGDNMYTWRDRYLSLFHDLWGRPTPSTPTPTPISSAAIDAPPPAADR